MRPNTPNTKQAGPNGRTPAPLMEAPHPDGPRGVRGLCSVLFAYDVGLSIDLAEAGRRITDSRQQEPFRHKRRAPTSFQYVPAPLRVTRMASPISVGSFVTLSAVEAVVFDFGAVSVAYTLPFDGTPEALLELSESLYENKELLDNSRRLVEALVGALGPALSKPAVAAFVEDYVVYELAEVDPGVPAAAAAEVYGPFLARTLRAERGPLAPDEVADALACRLAYGPEDAAIIDWNASILLQRDAADVRAVLEFANVELLEMRYLDDQLDRALDQAYRALSRRTWRDRVLVFSDDAANLRRIAALQMDSALLFENVNNALKVLGDHYLARVYRLAAQRLHLPEWDATILRKLETLESIYDKIADRQANRRMEALEWIIILLIAFEIVWAFAG